MNKKNIILLASCGIVVLSIYALDLFKLNLSIGSLGRFQGCAGCYISY